MNAIITSWELNAAEWIKTITKQSISSRRFTNKAILDTISTIEANSVVDIGCGEGWLTEALTNTGKKVIGVDAIDALLEHARTKSNALFYKMTFEDIASGTLIPSASSELQLIANTKVAFKEVINTTEKPISLIITITKTT